MRTLQRNGVTTFLEVGPDAVLTLLGHGSLTAPGHDAPVPELIPTMRRGDPEVRTLTDALGQLWIRGIEPDWSKYFAASGTRTVDLPTYPFQRRRYWLSASPGAHDPANPASEGPRHPLPSTRIRVAGLAPAEQRQVLLDFVRTEVAGVLQYHRAEDVAVDRPFQDLGLDSLAALQLRDRINQDSGLHLPAALVFTYPTPAALAQFLADTLESSEHGAAVQVFEDLTRLEEHLKDLPRDTKIRHRVASELKSLMRTWSRDSDSAAVTAVSSDDLESASDEQIFALIDDELDMP
jgi:acyl transferase domain-containing protein